MMLPFSEIVSKHNLKPIGVIHVGAHHGQEYDKYKEAGVSNIVFIEPCKKAFKVLTDRFANHSDVKLIKKGCDEITGQKMMNVEAANDGMSNSFLLPEKHLIQFPDIQFDYNEMCDVDRLDNLDIDREKYNMLAMDVQGFEDRVLRGGLETLKYIDIVYTEVNRDEIYKDCARIETLDAILSDFEKIEVTWAGGDWGDAIYKRVKPAVWVTEPFIIDIWNPVPKEMEVELFDAINEAFKNPKNNPVSHISKGAHVVRYHEFLRDILMGSAIDIISCKLYVTDANGIRMSDIPDKEEMAIRQRGLFKATDLKTLIFKRENDHLISDGGFSVDKFTSAIIVMPASSRYSLELYPAARKR